jgi:Periplasmic copper-binding protein (NosD)/Bacterial Ig domain
VTAGRSRRAVVLPLLTVAVFLAGCGSGTSATSPALNLKTLGPAVVAKGSEATSAVARCRVDAEAWQNCVSPFAAFDLASGPHTIDVEASHGGVSLLRRPAASTGDRVAVVAFANTSGGDARATASFTVAGARPGGRVSLAKVRPGATLRGLKAVSADVTPGASRIVLVDYYVDDAIVATAASAPWVALVDATQLTPGAHTLRAVAISLDRRRRASAPVAITVAASHVTPSGDVVRGALQAAIDALGPTGGTVRLPAGRFAVADLKVGSGVRLIGAGADSTTLVAATTPDEDAVDVTGHDVLISDLTIDDGGRGSNPDTSAVIFVHDAEDVVLRRLSLIHLRGYGVQVLGHHDRISVQQSTIDGDGRGLIGVAEWSEDASSSDVSVVRCVIRNLSKYGVLLQSFFNGHTWPHRRALAYGNDISQIHDTAIHDGTIEIGIWLAGANGAALDNLVRNAGWDGIETVVNATNPTIAGNVIRDTRTGIYVENVTRNALIEQNDIARVSVAGINLEPPHGGPLSGHLTIRQNRVIGAGIYGIGTGPGTLGSRITGNQVLDSGRMAILLDGASGNVVEGNDLRDRRKPAQQVWCVYDPQTRGSTTRNTVQNNDCSGSLNGGSTDPAGFSARRGSTP